MVRQGASVDYLLTDLIEHSSKLPLDNRNVTSGLLGAVYEYLIKKFANATNEEAGEFYSSRTPVQLKGAGHRSRAPVNGLAHDDGVEPAAPALA